MKLKFVGAHARGFGFRSKHDTGDTKAIWLLFDRYAGRRVDPRWWVASFGQAERQCHVETTA